MHYKYVIDLDERGQFQAHVEDHGGNTVWEVSYPEYYQDDETGEEMENTTIFEDGYMKNTEDVDGLEKYLKQMGTIPEGAELKSEDEFEEDDDDDEYEKGGYNPAQEILDSIYSAAGKVYRVVADIGGEKVGLTPWYTKAVIDDVAKEVTDKGYKIIKIEEKDDSYMEGGEIAEYNGTKAYTVNFKTYRNFPAAWRLTFYWGDRMPHVEVTKVTNNPFGGRLGTDFDTLDKAISHYKSPEMKVLLMQAADVAKKAGVPVDMFAMGGKTDEKWIQGAIKKEGALRTEAKREGLIKGDEKLSKTDLKKLEAKGGKTAKRARLAMTLSKMKGGGKTKSFKEMSFKEKSASIQSKLKGSKVSPKYQKLYGKTYDSKEAKQAADAITGKIVSKMKE